MKLSELIDSLQDLQQMVGEQDVEVMCSSDYGDYCHTEQALRIHEVTEPKWLVGSGYSRSGFAVPRSVEDGEDLVEEEVMPEAKRLGKVVLIRCQS